MTDDYDGNLDAYLSWQLAVALIRKSKLLTGELEPINDAERNFKCIKDRCRSPLACAGFGYCRELNFIEKGKS